jgi:hypothetical protein
VERIGNNGSNGAFSSRFSAFRPDAAVAQSSDSPLSSPLARHLAGGRIPRRIESPAGLPGRANTESEMVRAEKVGPLRDLYFSADTLTARRAD